jgi:hypothetical protein
MSPDSAGFLFNLDGMIVMAVFASTAGFDFHAGRAQAMRFNHIMP